AVQSPALPAAVRDAAVQLLAMRVPLTPETPPDAPANPWRNFLPNAVRPGVNTPANPPTAAAGPEVNISADDVKAALSRSGLFLERRLGGAAAARGRGPAPADTPPPNGAHAEAA